MFGIEGWEWIPFTAAAVMLVPFVLFPLAMIWEVITGRDTF